MLCHNFPSTPPEGRPGTSDVLRHALCRLEQMTVQWKTDVRQFHLSVGTCQPSSTANPHLPVLVQLQEELNTSRSLAQLVQVRMYVCMYAFV